MRVEPQKCQARTGDGGAENEQLARAGDVWQKQVFGIHHAASDIREDAQRGAHHNHRHDGQAIEAVGQVDRIAGAHDNQVGQHHKAKHTQRVAHLLEERQPQPGFGRQADVKA